MFCYHFFSFQRGDVEFVSSLITRFDFKTARAQCPIMTKRQKYSREIHSQKLRLPLTTTKMCLATAFGPSQCCLNEIKDTSFNFSLYNVHMHVYILYELHIRSNKKGFHMICNHLLYRAYSWTSCQTRRWAMIKLYLNKNMFH